MIICADCGQDKPHYAKGLCKTCYYRPYMRQYQEEHREEMLASMRRYYQRNQEKGAIRVRRWQQQNPDKVAAINRRWKQANPEKVVAKDARRRARKGNVANTLTIKQLEFERRIGEATYPGEKLHLHHLVSLSKGGGHTWGNIVFIPASLNLSIGDKLPREVYKQGELP